jgi:hypothetical protein
MGNKPSSPTTSLANPPPSYDASQTVHQKSDLKLDTTSIDAQASLTDETRTSDPKSSLSSSVPASATPSRRFSLRFLKSNSLVPEDQLAILGKYDIWVLMDDSYSMIAGEGGRWFEARDALAPLADLAGQYDADGLDLFFLNSPLHGDGLRVRSLLKSVFRRTLIGS